MVGVFSDPAFAFPDHALVRENRNAGRSAAGGAVHEHDLAACGAIVGKAGEKACHRNTQFEPSQCRAETIMHAVTERDVTIRAACDAQP